MIRKLVSFISVCLLSVLLLTACSETEPNGAYVPVKDDSGTITGYERKYYNDNGDITRWDVYTAQEEYDHYLLYEYDSDNRLAKETYYQADGIGVYYYAYSYDDNGNLAEKDYCTAKEGSERVLYQDGTESERITFDKNDELIKYEVYQDGSWVETELETQTEEPTE